MKYLIALLGSQQHYDAMAGKSDALPNWSPAEIQAMLDHDRATAIAERAARCPVPEGFPAGAPVDIRLIGEAPDPVPA